MRIYNTLTRKKEEFVPIDENEIKIYVCGPTVYNYFHIGNARPFVVFDTLRKYLEYTGKNVKFVQNFTDVNDNIINKGREEGVGPTAISERFIDEYFKDAAALNVKKATVHPRVTETIPEIIEFIETLIEKGYAYEIEGDVYYKSKAFDGYGKLSKQPLEDLEMGARISVGEKKQDPMDFALWKAQKVDDEQYWDSPWGKGRPGWHIECSVMAKKHLGETIDIHAGGQDLQFPHHENEIAQSEAYSGKPFANYWMHNGFLNVNNEKMSKSLNNFFMVRDILKDYSGEVVRYFLLAGHYRGPINFTDELMEQAKNSLARMENAKASLKHLIANGSGNMTEAEAAKLQAMDKHRQKFIQSMEDDLNTADAISAVFELITDINTAAREAVSKEFAEKCLSLLDELTEVLGLLRQDSSEGSVDPEVEALVAERTEAKKEKNFARADEIRDLLASKGWEVKDTPQGPQLAKK